MNLHLHRQPFFFFSSSHCWRWPRKDNRNKSNVCLFKFQRNFAFKRPLHPSLKRDLVSPQIASSRLVYCALWHSNDLFQFFWEQRGAVVSEQPHRWTAGTQLHLPAEVSLSKTANPCPHSRALLFGWPLALTSPCCFFSSRAGIDHPKEEFHVGLPLYTERSARRVSVGTAPLEDGRFAQGHRIHTTRDWIKPVQLHIFCFLKRNWTSLHRSHPTMGRLEVNAHNAVSTLLSNCSQTSRGPSGQLSISKT